MNRLSDLFLSIILLVILSPFLVLISLIILLEEHKSILYVQIRAGKDNKRFKIYKFRTMIHGAEKKGPVITHGYEDRRITRFGMFLRKTNLDELPQLINILMGDMSFIGPRPERPHFNEKFKHILEWEARLKIRPGLTGLAQVKNGRNPHDPSSKLKFDLDYIKRKSIVLDIQIIALTILNSINPFKFLK
jgi:lipopolysaccharide/colanic/teichoic acid biosynthesis glycosyltransferase